MDSNAKNTENKKQRWVEKKRKRWKHQERWLYNEHTN